MNNRIIAYISILVLITAMILTNINEIQNNEYTDAGIQQVSDKIEENGAVALFKHVPVNGWPDEPISSPN